MDKKICIITGANSGIGREAAIQILREGYHVILACRSEERGRAAIESIRDLDPRLSAELMLVDMGSQTSIRAFADEVTAKYPVIDVLIHNAALFDIARKDRQTTAEGVETVWAANHVGPVLLTELLLDSLKRSEDGRIITVSSKGLVAMPGLKVDLADPEFGNRKYSVTKAYYQSKLAQVMYTYWLADRLKDSGVTVNSIRVTAVQVDASRHADVSAFAKWIYSMKSKMSLTPAQMAETYTWLATSPQVRGVTGKYFDEKQQEVRSTPYASDRANQQAVMDLTQEYLKQHAEATN